MTYRITFQIKTPICFQGFVMFDGLIAYAYAQEQQNKVDRQTQRLSFDNIIDFTPMPIVKHPDGYFMASWMLSDYSDTVEFTGSWKKRWANEHDELANFGKRKRKVRVNAGPHKSYDMPMRLVDIPECYFYFQSADVQEVERLLKTHIVGIGKKMSQGNGLIESFEIEQIDFNPFNETIRPIPVKEIQFKDGLYIAYVGYYPPYWLPENQKMCII